MSEHIHAQPAKKQPSSATGVLQRKCDNCGKKRPLQRKASQERPSQVSSVAHGVPRSPGQSPDMTSRALMEPVLGYDLGRIPLYPPVPGVIQAKLAINAPGDIYEQEADRIADQVLATPAHHVVGSAAPHIQRLAGEPAGQAEAAPASVDQVLTSPGRPLEPILRQDMEGRFGHNFSRVRVHSGAAAEQSARDVNAHAYTVGHNLVFGKGRFAPETHEGRRLIAHELMHVVQQNQGRIAVPRLARQALTIESREPRSLHGSLHLPDLTPEDLLEEIKLIKKWLKDHPSDPRAADLSLKLESLQIEKDLAEFEQEQREAKGQKAFQKKWESKSDEDIDKKIKKVRLELEIRPDSSAGQTLLKRLEKERIRRRNIRWAGIVTLATYESELPWYQQYQLEKLAVETADWTKDERDLAQILLLRWFELRNQRVAPNEVKKQIKELIYGIYEQWLKSADQQILEECKKNPPSERKRMKARMSGHELCVSWFADESWGIGPTRLVNFESKLNIFSQGKDIPANTVYMWVRELRMQTNKEFSEMEEYIGKAQLIVGLGMAYGLGRPPVFGAGPSSGGGYLQFRTSKINTWPYEFWPDNMRSLPKPTRTVEVNNANIRNTKEEFIKNDDYPEGAWKWSLYDEVSGAKFCEIYVRTPGRQAEPQGGPELWLQPEQAQLPAIPPPKNRVFLKKSTEFSWGTEAFNRSIRLFREHFGYPPKNMGGNLDLTNLEVFQKKFAEIRKANPTWMPQDIANKAIRDTPFGKLRLRGGYADLRVQTFDYGPAKVKGTQLDDVPREVRVDALPTAIVPPNAPVPEP